MCSAAVVIFHLECEPPEVCGGQQIDQQRGLEKEKCHTVLLLLNHQQQQQQQSNGVGESNTKQRYNSPACHLFSSLPH